jgi:hypothetical protein
VIEPRVYRAAFLPALLAVVLAMFSLSSRPPALPQGLAADVLFDGRLAAATARSIVQRSPDRRPGTAGDRAVAGRVASVFADRGFAVERERFQAAGKELVNVVGRRAGRTRRQIVVVAAHDASSVPDATGSAADTAALLEFARVFQGRASRASVVLASIDGSTLGEVGASRLAENLGDPAKVDGVLVVSDLAAPRRRGALIVPWANNSTRAGIGLERTVAESIRQELEEPVRSSGALAQLARISFPIGIGAQGVLLERGFDTVRVSGSGELPPSGSGGPSDLDKDRLGGLGRATLRTATALDQGGAPEHGPATYVTAVSQVIPGWVLSVLALGLIMPALVAAVDAFARARRRGHPVAPWVRWLALAVLPFAAALLLAELLALAGAIPEPPPAPAAPADYPLDGAAAVVLAALTGGAGLIWLGGRFLLARHDPRVVDPGAPGAACAAMLALTVGALVVWALNPYAGLMLVPALHLWLFATLLRPPPRRRRLLLVAGGVLPPLLVALYYMVSLSLNPVSGAWYLLLVVSGHSVGLITALAGCVLLGVLVAVLAIALRRDEEPPPRAEERLRVYGPGAYAGPGSLGGTESALRR